MLFPDTLKYQNWRRSMVKNLQERGITDKRILAAMEKLPRHWFVPETLLDRVLYDIDYAVGIDCGQTISKPYTVAWQTQLLDAKRQQSVLEVGTGSGYQTAVLCELGLRVFTVERQRMLLDKAKELLSQLGYLSVRYYFGDCFDGVRELKDFMFDRILVTCGAEEIPEGLMRCLRVGGIMVVPVGDIDGQRMLKIIKNGDTPDQWQVEDVGDAWFVPMLQGKVGSLPVR